MLTKNQQNLQTKENDASFLQSQEWGELQKKNGRRVFQIGGKSYSALLLEYRLPFGKNYLYAARGPVVSEKQPRNHAKEERETTRKLNITLKEFLSDSIKLSGRPIFIRIEPEIGDSEENRNVLKTLGFKKFRPAQPQETIIIDLNKREEEIFNGFLKDTRYAVRVAEKRGVKIRPGAFEEFWKLFKETNKRQKLKIYPKKYYESVAELSGECRAEIFTAEAGERLISSALIVSYKDTATYLYAASAEGFGSLNAPSLLLWHAIRESKKAGLLKNFDLWGISEENKKWAGITKFKTGFGGSEVRYIGTWDYPLSKGWYFLYKIGKKMV